MRRLPFLLFVTRSCARLAPALLCVWSGLAFVQAGEAQAAQPGRPTVEAAPPGSAARGAADEQIDEASAEATQTSSEEAGVDDERARAHFSAGEAYFVVGRFSDAAREFALAYELSRRPEMLVNLARAHERGGELRAAVADLELLLEAYPSTSHRGEAHERIASLRTQLAAARQAGSARALSDSRSAGALPRARSAWPSWPTLSLAAGAAAATVVALGTGGRAHRIYRALERRCPDDACTEPFEAERTRGQRLARSSIGFTVAAVALAAGATVLWVYEARAHKRRVALGVGFDGGGSMARLRAQF